jgi:hypothetical protein
MFTPLDNLPRRRVIAEHFESATRSNHLATESRRRTDASQRQLDASRVRLELARSRLASVATGELRFDVTRPTPDVSGQRAQFARLRDEFHYYRHQVAKMRRIVDALRATYCATLTRPRI